MNEDDFRRIVREEVRREVHGPVCPECSEPLPESMRDIDRMVAEREEHDDEPEFWHLLCNVCDYNGPLESFDPSNQSLI